MGKIFKQKTAYEVVPCDWSSTCALPISTAWSPVDMPSGGETWELINEVTLSEDAMAVAFDKDKSGAAFALRKFAVFGWTKGSNASNTNGGAICINTANTADDNYSIVPPLLSAWCA